ncbi:hypothetical protein [Gordonia asplenii]|uniref:hypothetical protein n=1 Tax=Gordonia asplenii TaxID=2725283 RepID=UPI001B7D50C3|nr:hypothetical protein [Gordonia asplenii]
MTSPVPGPPKPSDISRRPDPAPTASPDAVVQRVDELLAQVDAVRATSSQSGGDGVDLGALERQAVLLEQAHQVLSVALEDVDRAT